MPYSRRGVCRYETGFNGYGGSSFSTAANYTAFANTTMLQRVSTFIANGKKNHGTPPLFSEWGLAGAQQNLRRGGFD